MSGSHTAVALSIAAHAVVGAVVAVLVGTSPRPAAVAAPEPVPEADPIDIEIFVEPLAPPATKVASEIGKSATRADTRTTRAPRGERVRHTTTTAETTIAPPSPRVPAVPSVQSIDRIAEQAPSSAPPVTMPAHSTFTMRVDPDGTVHLTDRPNLTFALGTSAAEIEEGRAEQWLDAHHERSNAVEMKMPPAGATIARFDITDWAMRTGGQDPYAYEKLKVLDATRDARAQIRARHREQQAIRTPALVRASVDDIAALAPEKRGAALVELWRDCDDSTAGEIARATIVEYVRTRTEFSAADLAAFARR